MPSKRSSFPNRSILLCVQLPRTSKSKATHSFPIWSHFNCVVVSFYLEKASAISTFFQDLEDRASLHLLTSLVPPSQPSGICTTRQHVLVPSPSGLRLRSLFGQLLLFCCCGGLLSFCLSTASWPRPACSSAIRRALPPLTLRGRDRAWTKFPQRRFQTGKDI